MISYQTAHELFIYNPVTGILRWKHSGKGRRPSKIAGGFVKGYGYVSVDQKRYMLHRVIWLLQTGRWPEFDIDHKDGNPSNNRWKNLRDATRTQNMRNARIRSNNKSGFKGVFWHKECKGWAAILCTGNQKRKWLGVYAEPRQAHSAYVAAAKKHFGEFARAR